MVQAAKRRRGKSKVAYFRRLMEMEPVWLERSNDELKARYLQDNPSKTEAHFNKLRQNIANLKSILRKKYRDEGKKPNRARSAGMNASGNKLEQLELAIEQCMDAAKGLDREGLETAINCLRMARNEVVWKIGQK